MDMKALKQAYYESLGKAKPTSGESIMKIPEAYKKAGGGLKGIGMGALQSIGSIAEMLNTPEGLKIASYAMDNPYLLPVAERVERQEGARQGQIADLVKQQEMIDAQKDIYGSKSESEMAESERKERLSRKDELEKRAYQEGLKSKEQESQVKEKSIAETKQSIDQDKTLTLEQKLAAKAMIDKGETPEFTQKGLGIPLLSPKRTVLKTPQSGKVGGGRYSVMAVKG